MPSQNNYEYERFDGKVISGLTYEQAVQEEEKDKKEKRAVDVISQLEQMSNSGNYTLEGAYALAAKNRVSDDPNVQAYIKSTADDMINKNTSKQFGFDQQSSGNITAQSQSQQPSSSGNTLSSWSSGSPFFDSVGDNQQSVDTLNNGMGSLNNTLSGWNVQDGKSSYTTPFPVSAPSSGTGNTVFSALQGGQPQPVPQQGGEQQNDFITRLPGDLQQYIKRTGLSVADYETPVREYLVSRDAAGFYKSIASLVDAKRKADEALANNDRERSFGMVKDLYGKAPMSGPDGSNSFTADDVTRGKVSFSTDRLPEPIHRSENKTIVVGGKNGEKSNENLVRLQESRTNLLKVLNENNADEVTKSNMLNSIDNLIEQETRRSGYSLTQQISENDIKQYYEAKQWIDAQEQLKENKRDPRFAQMKSAYEAMRQKFGIRY